MERLFKETTLSQLYDLFARGRELTQGEARDELGLSSKRHVRRLIERLRAKEVPLRERQVGLEKVYYLSPENQHPENLPFELTERHARSLLVAAKAARSKLLPTPLASALNEAVEILHEPLSKTYFFSFEPDDEAAHYHFEEPRSAELDRVVFDTLHEAMSERQSVRIDYLSAYSGAFSVGRKIDPLIFAVRKSTWLCIAYCHQREGIRDFSLVGIKDIQSCDPTEEQAYFTQPEKFDPQAYFRDRFSALSGDEVHTVRLGVQPDVAAYFNRKVYHPTQQIERERPDGSLIVSYEVAGLDEIASFVRSWGPVLKVLAPASLIDRIQSDARSVVALYQKPDM